MEQPHAAATRQATPAGEPVANVLDDIMSAKRREVEQARADRPLPELARAAERAPPPRDFANPLRKIGTVQVLAEVKKASPSAGVIRADFDPVSIAKIYEAHGAACLSVLTDKPYFQGELQYLTGVRAAVGLPVLRKDFIFDEYQLVEARAAGADAVLLIAECLPGDELGQLYRAVRALGMDCLIELYDADNLSRVLDTGAQLVGVNNRDLRTFVTRLEHTLDLAARVPPDRTLVSESGVRSRADVEMLGRAGVSAVLVGETLMRAADIGKALDELRGVVSNG